MIHNVKIFIAWMTPSIFGTILTLSHEQIGWWTGMLCYAVTITAGISTILKNRKK